MVMKGGEKLLEERKGRTEKEGGIRASAARLNSPEIEGAAECRLGFLSDDKSERAFTEIELIAIRPPPFVVLQARAESPAKVSVTVPSPRARRPRGR